MREIILSSITERLHCDQDHMPNKETIKAIQEAEKRKGIIEAKNAEDLFKKLGI